MIKLNHAENQFGNWTEKRLGTPNSDLDCQKRVSFTHSTRLIAKYRLYIALRLAALDNIFARQKGLPPGHAISSS